MPARVARGWAARWRGRTYMSGRLVLVDTRQKTEKLLAYKVTSFIASCGGGLEYLLQALGKSILLALEVL